MKRKDKGNAVSRFLTASTGIPLLRYNYLHNNVEAPKPYTINLTTSGEWWRFGEHIRDIRDEPGIPFVVRYDKHIDGVDNAIVGCTLHTFTQLLEQYEINLKRGEQ
jgi:hypothetical protein